MDAQPHSEPRVRRHWRHRKTCRFPSSSAARPWSAYPLASTSIAQQYFPCRGRQCPSGRQCLERSRLDHASWNSRDLATCPQPTGLKLPRNTLVCLGCLEWFWTLPHRHLSAACRGCSPRRPQRCDHRGFLGDREEPRFVLHPKTLLRLRWVDPRSKPRWCR